MFIQPPGHGQGVHFIGRTGQGRHVRQAGAVPLPLNLNLALDLRPANRRELPNQFVIDPWRAVPMGQGQTDLAVFDEGLAQLPIELIAQAMIARRIAGRFRDIHHLDVREVAHVGQMKIHPAPDADGIHPDLHLHLLIERHELRLKLRGHPIAQLHRIALGKGVQPDQRRPAQRRQFRTVAPFLPGHIQGETEGIARQDRHAPVAGRHHVLIADQGITRPFRRQAIHTHAHEITVGPELPNQHVLRRLIEPGIARGPRQPLRLQRAPAPLHTDPIAPMLLLRVVGKPTAPRGIENHDNHRQGIGQAPLQRPPHRLRHLRRLRHQIQHP